MSSEPVVHIISSHESYIAEYKYIGDTCQQDRPKGVTFLERVTPSLTFSVEERTLKGE